LRVRGLDCLDETPLLDLKPDWGAPGEARESVKALADVGRIDIVRSG
jgi:tRNA (Thr-GGU) A37 N-methylase